jgi:hypothetical protein
MGLDQSSLLLAPLTDHRNQLCRLSKMPSDERASSASTAISLFHFANHRSDEVGRSAVNRRVASSNLARGANSFFFNHLNFF